MSLSIQGASSTPIFSAGATPSPGPAAAASTSAAGTTLGAEQGAAAVVYQPGPVEREVALTYSDRDKKRRDAQAQAVVSQLQSTGRRDGITSYWAGQQQQLVNEPKSDEARIVAATGGTNLPPPNMPKTPALNAAIAEQKNVWGPVRPILTQLPEGWAKTTPIGNREAGRR